MFTQTLSSQNTTGYVVDLTDQAYGGTAAGCGKVDIFVRAETWVLPTADTAAAAPTATPAPAAGASTPYMRLLAGERLTVDLNQGVLSPDVPSRSARFKKLRIWSVAAGDVEIVGN